MKGAKKVLLPCLLTLVAGLSACSCSGSGKNNYAYDLDFTVDVKGQKISLWNPFGSDISEILEDLCGEFTRLTGVTVDVEDKTGYDTLRDAVTKSATSGKYCNVVFGYPDHFAAYVKSDIIVRLDYYFENDVHNSTFEPDGVDFKKSDFYADYMVENETIEYDENGKGFCRFERLTDSLVKAQSAKRGVRNEKDLFVAQLLTDSAYLAACTQTVCYFGFGQGNCVNHFARQAVYLFAKTICFHCC